MTCPWPLPHVQAPRRERADDLWLAAAFQRHERRPLKRLLAERDLDLEVMMEQLLDQFPRFGYRRILVFMEQLRHAMGPDKALRRWQKARSQVPRKRVAQSRPQPLLPWGANEVWAYDFVHDACINGPQLKCLTIIDEYTRV